MVGRSPISVEHESFPFCSAVSEADTESVGGPVDAVESDVAVNRSAVAMVLKSTHLTSKPG